MATRPTIPVTIRASDTNYSGLGNDLDTTPTKIQRSGAELALGHVPDSPLGSRPVSAQGVNYDDNVLDQWAKWTSEGSNAAGGDAHIVETNSTGDISVITVNCDEVRVSPNIGSDGIEVTTTGGSKGVEVLQDATSTDYGVAVVAPVGATAPGFYSETRSSVGLQLTHGSVAGLSTQAVSNGGVVGPSIKMTANTIDPTDDSVGTIWNRQENGINNVKMGMGSSGGYPIIAKNAPCYARSGEGNFNLSGSQTNQTIRSNFSFITGQIPQAADQVRVTIWGRVNFARAQNNSVTLEVRDKTVGGDPTICTMVAQSPPHTTGSVGVNFSVTFSEIYTLPSAGARSFDLVWSGDVSGSDGNFSGFVEIEQLRG